MIVYCSDVAPSKCTPTLVNRLFIIIVVCIVAGNLGIQYIAKESNLMRKIGYGGGLIIMLFLNVCVTCSMTIVICLGTCKFYFAYLHC
jgi:hypothetical protein